jgi:hypothetical protein
MTTDATVSLNDVTVGLADEGVDLRDMAEEPSGAWASGWYKSTIIEGYATAKSGKQLNTEDTISKNGDSRNLRVCFKLVRANGDERTLTETYNYRPSDFTPERVAYIKELRVELKDVKHWPDKDAQRSSLAIAKISQLQKAVGLERIKFVNNGIAAAAFVGGTPDARIGTDDNGYNVVTAFAPAGTKTGGKKA